MLRGWSPFCSTMPSRYHPNPFRPVQPGMEAVLTPWLIPAYFAGIGLPGLGALWFHLRQPPGGPTMAELKFLHVVDMMAFGLAVFDAMAVLTVALGCMIVTLMKARPRHADAMHPPEE